MASDTINSDKERLITERNALDFELEATKRAMEQKEAQHKQEISNFNDQKAAFERQIRELQSN